MQRSTLPTAKTGCTGSTSSIEKTTTEGTSVSWPAKVDIKIADAPCLPSSAPLPSHQNQLPPPEPNASAPIAPMQVNVLQPLCSLPGESTTSGGSTPATNWASGSLPVGNAFPPPPAGSQRRAHTAPQMNHNLCGAPATTHAHLYPPNRSFNAYPLPTHDVREFQARSQFFDESLFHLQECISIIQAEGNPRFLALQDKLMLAMHGVRGTAEICSKVHQELLRVKFCEHDMVAQGAVLGYQSAQLQAERDAFEAEKRAFGEQTKKEKPNPLIERIENLRAQGVEALGMLKLLLEKYATEIHSSRLSAGPPAKRVREEDGAGKTYL